MLVIKTPKSMIVFQINSVINCNLVVQRNSYCIGEKLVLFGSLSRETVSYIVYNDKEDSWSVQETKF